MGLFSNIFKESKNANPHYTDPVLERVKYIRFSGYDNLRNESFVSEREVDCSRQINCYGYEFLVFTMIVGERFTYNDVTALLDERKQLIPMDAYNVVFDVDCSNETIRINITRK